MAIDELLLSSIADVAVLRYYDWSEPTVTFGYFNTLRSARAAISEAEEINYVRRWTGGGVVDHRTDLTYTLIIPKCHPMANLRGAESYRIIHEAVATALNAQGVVCKLTGENSDNASAACFENPVAYDIVTPEGRKLAGAGQKRSRHGLLHQGSVVGIANPFQWKIDFLIALTSEIDDWSPSPELLAESTTLAGQKYRTDAWLEKR